MICRRMDQLPLMAWDPSKESCRRIIFGWHNDIDQNDPHRCPFGGPPTYHVFGPAPYQLTLNKLKKVIVLVSDGLLPIITIVTIVRY